MTFCVELDVRSWTSMRRNEVATDNGK